MGLGTYWARKDDQTDELKTVKPWEEEVSNGDKFFPDPNKKVEETEVEEPQQTLEEREGLTSSTPIKA